MKRQGTVLCLSWAHGRPLTMKVGGSTYYYIIKRHPDHFTMIRVLQSVKKLVFDRLAEVKGASKTSNSDSSAYMGYGRVRVAM